MKAYLENNWDFFVMVLVCWYYFWLLVKQRIRKGYVLLWLWIGEQLCMEENSEYVPCICEFVYMSVKGSPCENEHCWVWWNFLECDFGEREIKEKKINFDVFVCQETTRTTEKRKEKKRKIKFFFFKIWDFFFFFKIMMLTWHFFLIPIKILYYFISHVTFNYANYANHLPRKNFLLMN